MYWVKAGVSILATAAYVVLCTKLIGSGIRHDSLLALLAWGALSLVVALAWDLRGVDLVATLGVSAAAVCLWVISFLDFPPAVVAAIRSSTPRLMLGFVPLALCVWLGVRFGSKGVTMSSLALALAAVAVLQAHMAATEAHVVGGWRAYVSLTPWSVSVFVGIPLSAGLLAGFLGWRLRRFLVSA